MVRIDKNITINRPVEDVWQYLTNLENMPLWDRDVIEAKQISDGTIGAGTTVKVIDTLIGRRSGLLQIIEFSPYNRFVIRAAAGPSIGNLEFTLEPVSDGTKVREISEIELHGFLKLFEPAFTLFGKKFSQGDFANLKRVLEAD